MKNHYKINLLNLQKQMFSLLKLSNGLKLLLFLLVLPLHMIAQDKEDAKVVKAIVKNENNQYGSGKFPAKIFRTKNPI